MKSKIIVLVVAWALFYGIAVMGAVAHRNKVNLTPLLEASNNELSQTKVENR